MPLDIRDYMADTTHLSTIEHGAYLLLLMAYWLKGSGLEDNDRQLAQIARVGPKEWKTLRPVLAPFFVIDGGRWTQKRAEEELGRARHIMSERSEAGKSGAEKRWQTHGKRMANEVANVMANECQTQWQIDAPIPSQKKPNNNSSYSVAAREPNNEDHSQLLQLLDLLKIEANPHKMVEASRVFGALKATGCTIGQMRQAAEEASRNGAKISSLRYIEARTIELRDTISAQVEIEYTDAPGWRDRIAASRKYGGKWLAQWGPKIGEPGCLVPPEIIAKSAAAQGIANQGINLISTGN